MARGSHSFLQEGLSLFYFVSKKHVMYKLFSIKVGSVKEECYQMRTAPTKMIWKDTAKSIRKKIKERKGKAK